MLVHNVWLPLPLLADSLNPLTALITWDMGHGTWDMGHGTWDMGHGTWDMGHYFSDDILLFKTCNSEKFLLIHPKVRKRLLKDKCKPKKEECPSR